MKYYWIIVTGTNYCVGPFAKIRDAEFHISKFKIVGGLIVKEIY